MKRNSKSPPATSVGLVDMKRSSRRARNSPIPLGKMNQTTHVLVEAEVLRETRRIVRHKQPKLMIYDEQFVMKEKTGMDLLCGLMMMRHGLQTDKLQHFHVALFCDAYRRAQESDPDEEVRALANAPGAMYCPERGAYSQEAIEKFLDWLIGCSDSFQRVHAPGDLHSKAKFIESFINYKNICALYRPERTRLQKDQDYEPLSHWSNAALYSLSRAWAMDGVGQPHGLPQMITREVDGEDIETAALQAWNFLEQQDEWPSSLFTIALYTGEPGKEYDPTEVLKMEDKLERLHDEGCMQTEMQAWFAEDMKRRKLKYELKCNQAIEAAAALEAAAATREAAAAEELAEAQRLAAQKTAEKKAAKKAEKKAEKKAAKKVTFAAGATEVAAVAVATVAEVVQADEAAEVAAEAEVVQADEGAKVPAEVAAEAEVVLTGEAAAVLTGEAAAAAAAAAEVEADADTINLVDDEPPQLIAAAAAAAEVEADADKINLVDDEPPQLIAAAAAAAEVEADADATNLVVHGINLMTNEVDLVAGSGTNGPLIAEQDFRTMMAGGDRQFQQVAKKGDCFLASFGAGFSGAHGITLDEAAQPTSTAQEKLDNWRPGAVDHGMHVLQAEGDDSPATIHELNKFREPHHWYHGSSGGGATFAFQWGAAVEAQRRGLVFTKYERGYATSCVIKEPGSVDSVIIARTEEVINDPSEIDSAFMEYDVATKHYSAWVRVPITNSAQPIIQDEPCETNSPQDAIEYEQCVNNTNCSGWVTVRNGHCSQYCAACLSNSSAASLDSPLPQASETVSDSDSNSLSGFTAAGSTDASRTDASPTAEEAASEPSSESDAKETVALALERVCKTLYAKHGSDGSHIHIALVPDRRTPVGGGVANKATVMLMLGTHTGGEWLSGSEQYKSGEVRKVGLKLKPNSQASLCRPMLSQIVLPFEFDTTKNEFNAIDDTNDMAARINSLTGSENATSDTMITMVVSHAQVGFVNEKTPCLLKASQLEEEQITDSYKDALLAFDHWTMKMVHKAEGATGNWNLDNNMIWLDKDAFLYDAYIWDESSKTYVKGDMEIKTLSFMEQEKERRQPAQTPASNKSNSPASMQSRSPRKPRSMSAPPMSPRSPRKSAQKKLSDKLKEEQDLAIATAAAAKAEKKEKAKEKAKEQAKEKKRDATNKRKELAAAANTAAKAQKVADKKHAAKAQETDVESQDDDALALAVDRATKAAREQAAAAEQACQAANQILEQQKHELGELKKQMELMLKHKAPSPMVADDSDLAAQKTAPEKTAPEKAVLKKMAAAAQTAAAGEAVAEVKISDNRSRKRKREERKEAQKAEAAQLLNIMEVEARTATLAQLRNTSQDQAPSARPGGDDSSVTMSTLLQCLEEHRQGHVTSSTVHSGGFDLFNRRRTIDLQVELDAAETARIERLRSEREQVLLIDRKEAAYRRYGVCTLRECSYACCMSCCAHTRACFILISHGRAIHPNLLTRVSYLIRAPGLLSPGARLKRVEVCIGAGPHDTEGQWRHKWEEGSDARARACLLSCDDWRYRQRVVSRWEGEHVCSCAMRGWEEMVGAHARIPSVVHGSSSAVRGWEKVSDQQRRERSNMSSACACRSRAAAPWSPPNVDVHVRACGENRPFTARWAARVESLNTRQIYSICMHLKFVCIRK